MTGVMRDMEIQNGKGGMKDALYNRQYGATAGCKVHLLENSISLKMPWPMQQEGFI